MLTAKDIMRKEVPTVSPETTVQELGKLFIEKKITGLAVVDKSGKLIGMVTENDLISQNKSLHIPTVLRLFDAIIPLESSHTFEKEMKKIAGSTVDDICTRELITISEDATLEEIATIMSEKTAHHLPVVRDGALVGMIDQHDVIRGISA